jgi:hypothetical protein
MVARRSQGRQQAILQRDEARSRFTIPGERDFLHLKRIPDECRPHQSGIGNPDAVRTSLRNQLPRIAEFTWSTT